MSNSGSDQGFNMQAVSSLLSDHDDDKEADAALVDSFFLPGGLFSDEGNGSDGNENIVTKSNSNMQNDSTPSRLSVHLSNNPWESGTSSSIPPNLTTESSIGNMQQLRPAYNMNRDHNGYPRSLQNIYNEDAKTNIHHSKLNNQFRNENARNTLGTPNAGKNRFHQIPDLVFPKRTENQQHNVVPSMTEKHSSRILGPPPGFHDGPSLSRSIDNMEITESNSREYSAMDFIATTNTSMEHKYLVAAKEDHVGTKNNGKPPVHKDNCLRSNFQDRDVNLLPPTIQHNTSLPSSQKSKTAGKFVKDMHIPTHGVQSHEFIGEEHNSYREHNAKEELVSKTTPDYNSESYEESEAEVVSMADLSKGSAEISKDSTEGDYGDEDEAGGQEEVYDDDDDDDDNDDDDDHEEEEDMDENSIPSTICVSVSAESNSSSLSTFSEVDKSELSSSHESGDVQKRHDEDLKDEAVGYATDEAHKSETVLGIGNSLDSSAGKNGKPDQEPCKIPAPSVNSVERKTGVSIESNNFLHARDGDNSSNFTTEKISELLRSTVEIFPHLIDLSLSSMQKIISFIKTTKRYKRFSSHMDLLCQDFQSIRNWLVDVKEVCVVLLTRLLNASQKHSRGMIEAVTIIFSFLFVLLKFGLIEALEEFNGVTSCYMVFYLMPKTCVAIMGYINLPHWTPHTVTWLAIFSLCQQVDAGTLHETSNISITLLLRKLVMDSSASTAKIENDRVRSKSTNTKNCQGPPPRQQQDQLSRQKDMQICFLLLKTIKTTLPILYMVEGFSSDFGSIIGATGTDLLTVAFVISVLRKSLLSSPIAWVSWALQILLAAFLRSCIFLDVLVLLIGLSSIRLIRFLDTQRMRGNGVHERSSK